MARDLAEQERAFILTLPADTGRDLDAWMGAIAESGLSSRNDIIDWLRHHGFTFSNASWMERIHHNGGRLIYAGDEARPALPERAITAAMPKAPPPPLPAEAAPEPSAQPDVISAAVSGPAISQLEGASDSEVAALLLAAKGLRPLAEFMLREMDQIVPAMVLLAQPPSLTLASPMPFAALLPAPKEIRLYADFGPQSRDRSRKADSMRFPSPYPDVLILNDARQIDDRFRELVALAYTRALK